MFVKLFVAACVVYTVVTFVNAYIDERVDLALEGAR